MKAVKILIISLFASISIWANHPTHFETISFKVFGNCEMCQERIEKAMKLLGVKSGVWNVDTKIATVTFDIHSIGPDDIHKAIAAVGYDTEQVRADDKVYKKLPGCCQYEREKIKK